MFVITSCASGPRTPRTRPGTHQPPARTGCPGCSSTLLRPPCIGAPTRYDTGSPASLGRHRDHRRGGRLPVRARHPAHIGPGQEPAQRLRIRRDGDTAPPGFGKLRVIRPERDRMDHLVHPVEVIRRIPLVDLDLRELVQKLTRQDRARLFRPRHHRTSLRQDHRQRGRADTADPDHVHPLRHATQCSQPTGPLTRNTAIPKGHDRPDMMARGGNGCDEPGPQEPGRYPVRHARQQSAAIPRTGRRTTTGGDLNSYIKEIVDLLPPLTSEQRDLLALIFHQHRRLTPRHDQRHAPKAHRGQPESDDRVPGTALPRFWAALPNRASLNSSSRCTGLGARTRTRGTNGSSWCRG